MNKKTTRVQVEETGPEEKSSGLYFTTPKHNLKFVKSGCKTLDLALGGGWPRGRISNVVGDKSTGKCIRNAYVVSGCNFERLDDFGEREDTKYGLTEFLGPLALNSKKTIQTSHFWKERVRETIKITTRHGYTLEGTFDHKVMVWSEDCTSIMKPLSQLKVGDVAVIAKEPKQPDEYIRHLWYDSRRKKGDNSSIDIKIPTYLTEQLAELLGFYVADGSTAGRNISFSNSKPWFRKRFLKNMKDVFGISEKDCRYKEESGAGTYTICRTQLFDFFNHLFDGEIKVLTGRFKYIPKYVMTSPKNIQAAFLRGLIDCDSENQRYGVVYTTASAKLAEQVHLLLLNFGVVANKQSEFGPKQYSDHLYWNVSFWGKYATKYNEEIGYGRGKLKSGKITKSDFDNIPFLADKFKKDVSTARDMMGWSKNGTTKFGRFPTFQLVAENITFENLDKIIQSFSKIENWFDLSLYKELQASNYHFDPITKIEVKQDVVDVYDVHVPDEHLFWANGFINHNTLLMIEAAANFAMSEPKGKIRYRESESAFDQAYAAALGFPIEKVDFGDPVETVEDIFEDLEKVIEGAKGPELYIVDSLDALSDRAEMDREIDKGSYGAGKAKMLSQLFRRQVRGLAEKDITLMVVSQIRDNIGVMIGKKYTRSGGHALDFYSTIVLWLAQIEKIKKTVKGITRPTGIEVKATVEKNKISLPFRDATFPIMFGHGIDDRKACEKYLDMVKIAYDKDTSLADMHQLVETSWWEIEEKFLVGIEPKYGKGERP